MKVSRFDFNHAKSLYYLLEEAHVGRAASRLGITAAAASNALRRLRQELGDQLLVKKGRGLVRTRVGEELRGAARDVVTSIEGLIRAARPFESATYRGEIPIAIAEHVANFLLPVLDELVRNRSPYATLAIASIPLGVAEWLEQSRGVLVGPMGAFAATNAGDALASESFYEDRYVCVMRRGHPLESRRVLANRQSAALKSLDRHLPAGFRVVRPEGGYFLWIELPALISSVDLYRIALSRGISIAPGPIFSQRHEFDNFMRLNYGYPWTAATDAAVATLADIMRALIRKAAT